MSVVRDQTLYDKCKRIVKAWECKFMKNNGRPPSKLDIKEADKYVRDAYGTYFRLKTAALEESLMDILDEDDGDNDHSNIDSHCPIDSCSPPNSQKTDSQNDSTTSPNTQKSNDTPINKNKDEVWGDHLNNKPIVEPKVNAAKKEEMNSSFTKKLFANSKFAKRNPRKSLLNTSAKLDSSLNSSVNTSVCSASQPITTAKEPETTKEGSLAKFNATLPVASDVRQVSAKSVNVFSHILNSSVGAPARQVDKGWLQRVAVNTGTEINDIDINKCAESDISKIVNSEIVKDSVTSVKAVNKVAPVHESDDDDVISDSDHEDDTGVYQVSKRIKLSLSVNNIPPRTSSNTLTARNILSINIEDSNVNTIQSETKSTAPTTTNAEFKENVVEPVKTIEPVKNVTESTNKIVNSKETEHSEEEEDVAIKKATKKGRRKVLESSGDNDSDYELPKQAKKRKRKAEPKKPPVKKPKAAVTQRKTRTPRGRPKKEEVQKEPEDDKGKETEEYEVEYTLKPPPPTVPRFKDLLQDVHIDTNSTPEAIPKAETKEALKKQVAKNKLLKKIASGALNENFVRIDIKKKVYVRGKKHMNFTKFKKQQWKNKKKSLYGPDMDMGGCDGGELVCFKCGKTGHFARKCKNETVNKLLPLDAVDEEECTLPSLEEASKMARENVLAVHIPNLIGETSEPAEKAEDAGSEITSKDSEDDEDVYEFNDDAELESFILNTENFEAAADEDSRSSEPSIQKKWINMMEEKDVKPLYSLKEDGSLQDTPQEVFEALQQFGHTSFRSGQEQAIMRILSGLSTLVTLSTGSGKSLCYQLPAYLYAKRKNCISLVISPLVSLMEDQVSGISSFLKAACLHTAQTATQREKIMKLVEAGELNVLLVSPEAVTAGERKSGFGSLLRKLPPIAFACIDEAHCVSQWSHNFRPSYLVICRVLRERLGIKTVLGLTATSTYATSSSIVGHLQIHDGHNGVISDIPLPDNLSLSVSSDTQRDAALRNLLLSEPFDSFDSIIVYCTRREECERIAGYLRASIKPLPEQATLKKYKSLSPVAEPYHAGLPASKRRTVQNAFMGSYLRIVVATVAFGMGINKANIRAVIHYNMPSSFESYVQEVGRAGRDGLPAQCHLFLDSEGRDQNELRRHIYANSMDRHAVRKLLQKIFVPCGCKNICPRHEVAFSIEDTVKMLDVPEENISTLLCYLELHERHYLEVLTPVYTVCKIIAYGTAQHIKKAARDCPPLAMALALQKKENLELKENVFEFPVVDVAAAMGWDSGYVKSKLKNLEWTSENNMPKRTTLTVEFSNLGFHLRTPGNLTPSELDEALDSLFAKKNEQEVTALKQLQVVYTTLTAVSERNYQLCLKENYQVKNKELKMKIREYFSSKEPLIDIEITHKALCNEGQIISDVRNLVGMYRDNNFTGRAVARIFHGIQSPNYPAVIWGRCKFWRAHLNSDFNKVCQIATAELLKLM